MDKDTERFFKSRIESQPGEEKADEYGEVLRKERKEKKIIIVELAEKMGVSQAYLARVEMGKITPTAEQFETIRSFIQGQIEDGNKEDIPEWLLEYSQ